jgi:phenylacetate-CoA ligase
MHTMNARRMQPLSSPEDRAIRRELIRQLRETPPEFIEAAGEADTVRAFQRVAATVPFYGRLLDERGIDAAQVRGIDDFVRLAPRLSKLNTFGANAIAELCVDGNLNGVKSMLTSSGHGATVMAYGVNTQTNLAHTAMAVDTGLQYLFGVDDKSTILINCLPMGVKVDTQAAFLAETSVREDMVHAIVKKFAPEFDQIVLIGEGSFIKKILEDGRDLHGIDWPSLDVHVVTGEEGIAENYRSYIGSLIGVTDFDDPAGKLVGSSMGVAELGLNLFHETRETIRIRRLAHRDPALRRALFGEHATVCPMLFVRYPNRCHVEALARADGQNELVVSMLSEEAKIPLLRYASGDIGGLHGYSAMVELLARHGHAVEPELKLPFVHVSGRGRSVQNRDGQLFPEEVKEALYADFGLAGEITGNFRLLARGDEVELHVQLRQGRSAEGRGASVDALLSNLHPLSDVRPQVRFHAHEAFPYNMNVDWERKFAYL